MVRPAALAAHTSSERTASTPANNTTAVPTRLPAMACAASYVGALDNRTLFTGQPLAPTAIDGITMGEGEEGKEGKE